MLFAVPQQRLSGAVAFLLRERREVIVRKRVWTFQYKKDVDKKGADKASWYVGWYDLDDHRHAESCGPGTRGEKEAKRRARKIEAELLTNIHEPNGKVKWSTFLAKYEETILPNLAPESGVQIKAALKHFARIVKPGRMDRIKQDSIDAFVATRRTERGKKPGSKVSPATVNKDLRHIKAALRVAHEWGYLRKVPKVRMLREPEKLPRYVTAEHFSAIYQEACPRAELPQNPGQHFEPADWWRALVVMAYMTGWRIGEILALRREDLDLDNGTALTRAEDNKGNRDELVPLHPLVVDHLRKIIGFHPLVFRWCHDQKDLWNEFRRIQEAAGIHLPCRERHEHTDSCHVYGFHDFRRAFATVNHDTMSGDALQRLMRHKSYSTTQGYISMAGKLTRSVEALHVPDVLRKAN